jgi:hypothetical protein
MEKKAKNVEEQICILKERGMNFDFEIEKANEILKKIITNKIGYDM